VADTQAMVDHDRRLRKSECISANLELHYLSSVDECVSKTFPNYQFARFTLRSRNMPSDNWTVEAAECSCNLWLRENVPSLQMFISLNELV